MNQKQKGIFYIILAALSFATMSLFVQLAGDVPFIQKSLFRNVVALIVSFTIIMRTGKDFSFQKSNLKYLIIRSIFGTLGVFLNFYAIENLVLSDATMIAKLSPFFVIIFSYFILKEKIKAWQVTSIIIAFTGSLFIINPLLITSLFTNQTYTSSIGSFASIIGLLGAMSAGVAYTIIRKLAMRKERGAFIVFFFSTFSTAVCLPFVLIDFYPMSINQVFILLGAGIFASCGQFAITAAYSHAPAKDISIYDYSQIIFSAIYGFIFFNQLPSSYSLIGYIIIISVAIYMYDKQKTSS